MNLEQTNRELNKHIQHCLLDNPLRANQNRRKKLMCATGVWGGEGGRGGGGIAPGEWFLLWTALKRRPQLLSQSYGLATQCKCSYTMKTALKSHFF